jgi:predicted component of type VI protein secretion system
MAAAGDRKVHRLLRVQIPGEATRLVVLDTVDLNVGRAPENDLPIDDPEISRRHARFVRCASGCEVQDQGTSNGTHVNGRRVDGARLASGDVVKLGDVEIVYDETTRPPAALGAKVVYASQLKEFGPRAVAPGDGEATILGLSEEVASGEDELEVAPPGDFSYDLHQLAATSPTARNLDLDLADLDDDGTLDLGRDPEAPQSVDDAPTAVGTRVWSLDDPVQSPARGAAETLSLHLEIDGLPPELRSALEAFVGKIIEMPSFRVRVKDGDLGA